MIGGLLSAMWDGLAIEFVAACLARLVQWLRAVLDRMRSRKQRG